VSRRLAAGVGYSVYGGPLDPRCDLAANVVTGTLLLVVSRFVRLAGQFPFAGVAAVAAVVGLNFP
jgi:hypothetical protein